MSAVKSPNPQNLVVLAAVGLGAYWFFSQRARAATAYSTPAAIPSAAPAGNQAGSIINAVSGLVGNLFKSANGTYDGRAAQPWDTTPTGSDGPAFNNPSAYVSSAIDGAAFNPPDSSAYDAYTKDMVGAWGF